MSSYVADSVIDDDDDFAAEDEDAMDVDVRPAARNAGRGRPTRAHAVVADEEDELEEEEEAEEDVPQVERPVRERQMSGAGQQQQLGQDYGPPPSQVLEEDGESAVSRLKRMALISDTV